MSEQTAAADAAPASADAHPTGEGQAPAPADTSVAPASDDDVIDDDDASEAGKALARRRGGFQRRIDELTAQARTAERDRDHWRELAMRSAGQQPPQDAPAGTGTPRPSAPQLPPDLAHFVGPEPKPDDFPAGEYDPGFARAVARYEGRMAQAELAAAARAQHARSEASRRAEDFASAAMAAEKQHPDFREAVGALGQRLPNAVADMIAEAGVDVAYAVAKSPEYEREIANARSPAAVARVIGRIEARLEAARNAPPPKPTAAPPPPAQTARGGATPSTPDPEAMTAAEYYAARKAGRLP